MADIPYQFALEGMHGSEKFPGNHVALNLAEPGLHVVEPGEVGGRELQGNSRMRGQKGLDLRGLMRHKITGDHMDLLSTELMRQDG